MSKQVAAPIALALAAAGAYVAANLLTRPKRAQVPEAAAVVRTTPTSAPREEVTAPPRPPHESIDPPARYARVAAPVIIEKRDEPIALSYEEEALGEEHAPPPDERPALRAGAADDNLQFNAFLGFVEAHDPVAARALAHRTLVRVRDRRGLPLANAKVRIVDGGEPLIERTTYADGRAMLFASESPAFRSPTSRLSIEYDGRRTELDFGESPPRKLEVQLDRDRPELDRVALDVAFIVDTTASMGDEIDKLKSTIEMINFQITHFHPQPDVRFGMVLYRDREDDYATQIVELTRDFNAFQLALDEVEPGGGGDHEEDVQEALENAVRGLKWRSEGLRLAFLIGDAPPHLDYHQTYTYQRAIKDAARRGIKIAAIGASGLDEAGELVWRRIAQYTMAPFVFLTYGETGDSEGSPESVSHHVGSNWFSADLDAIIVRFVKTELTHLGPKVVATQEDYFEARKHPGIAARATLQQLFTKSSSQLASYSLQRIEARTPAMVMPIVPGVEELITPARRLDAHLQAGIARTPSFQLIAVQETPQLMEVLREQFAARYDERKIVELGKLIPARLAVLGELDRAGEHQLQLFLRLVHLETGEVLSVSMLELDRALVE